MRNALFIIVLLGLILSPAGTNAQNDSYHIFGRVIDAEGKPASRAVVSFENLYARGGDHVIPTVRCSKDGVFSYSVIAQGHLSIVVYSEEANIDEFWTPVGSLALQMSGLRRFQGTSVKKRGRVDLGDIPLTFDYEKVTIDFRKLSKLPKNPLSLPDLQGLKVGARYENKRTFPPTSIPRRAFHDTFLDLSLQKGEWKLIFSFQKGKKYLEAVVLVKVGPEVTVSYPN
jgi:hypothetical protein